MRRTLKIAIYSGVLPATTFVENLIKELGNHHQVYVFGTIKSSISYTSKNIYIIETPTNQWRNISLTISRVLKLVFINPNFIGIAYKEARRYKSFYEQWMRFCRFIPVLLYKPDVFHLQWASKIDRWMFLKQAYNCKIALSLLGSNLNVDPISNPNLKELYLKHFPNIDGFQAVSNDLAKTSINFGAKPEMVNVIRTTILEDTFKHFKIKAISNKTLELVSVGRHHWIKGYKYVILALAFLKRQGVIVNYTIIAQGLVPDELSFLVQQFGIQNQVSFKAGLPQEKLFSYMQNFDVLVLPSLSEGVANVALEAMTLGIPVISSDCGGMSEIIINNETGWLVPIANPLALSRAIIEFSNATEEIKQRIIQKAFKLVSTQFDTEKVVSEYLEFYKTI